MVCSRFWKLDKIDKIVIALTFIVVSMFSVFNCFCFASEVVEDVNVSSVNDVIISYTEVLVSANSDNYVSFYFPVSAGVEYDITLSDILDYRSGFVQNVSVGEQVYDFSGNSESYPNNLSFVSEYDGYFFVVSSQTIGNEPNISVISSYTPTGYSKFINTLVSLIGISSLWSVFENSVPFILLVLVCSLGFYFIIGMLKGLSKGKGRL